MRACVALSTHCLNRFRQCSIPAVLAPAVLYRPPPSVGDRGMAVGKRGVPKMRREVLKDQESRERRKQHAREAKARNASDMDRHVQQAYKVCITAPSTCARRAGPVPCGRIALTTSCPQELEAEEAAKGS
jgi:hypothetical protein